MKPLKAKDWLNLAFLALPFWAAYDLGASDYRLVQGTLQKMPFSLERAIIGFFIGVVLALILYGASVAIRAVVRKIRAGSISN